MSCYLASRPRRAWANTNQHQSTTVTEGNAATEIETNVTSTTTIPSALYADLKQDEIRILVFKSLKERDPLELEMRTITLGQAPFMALSYEWGNPDDVRFIKLNSTTIPVGSNLYLAPPEIRRLFRKKGRSKRSLIWIDALCINQSNIPEKSQQVQKMGDIFSQASHVLMWLGPADDTSDGAVDFIEKWCSVVEENTAFLDALKNPAATFSENPNTRGDRLAKAITRDMDHAGKHQYIAEEDVKAFELLLRRSYWRRVWTLQEQVLATAGTYICGSKSLDAYRLWLALLALYYIPKHTESPMATKLHMFANGCLALHLRLHSIRGSDQHYDSLLNLHDSLLGGNLGSVMAIVPKKRRLLTLIIYGGTLQATDPRDKILALIGLVGEEERLIEPNYEWDAAEVYTRCWTVMLRQPGGVDLGQFSPIQAGTALPNLLSSVPDFQLPHQFSMWYQNDDSGNALQSNLSWSADGKKLTFQGFLFDEISFVRYSRSASQTSIHLWGFVAALLCHGRLDQIRILQPDYPWPVLLFLLYMIEDLQDDKNINECLEHAPFRDRFSLFYAILAENAIRCDMDNDTIVSLHMPPQAEYSQEFLRLPEKKGRVRGLYKELLHQTLKTLNLDPEIAQSFNYFDISENPPIKPEYMHAKRLLISKRGYIGMANLDIREGDVVCLVAGCPRPLVLRRVGDTRKGEFELVGRADFPLMTGELGNLTDATDICLV